MVNRLASARRITLSGHVQGVGFRPFVYRLARALDIKGWVRNATGAVDIHAEGPADALETFARGLIEQAPAIARPRLVSNTPATLAGHAAFVILPSTGDALPDIHVPPDYFTCDDCLREMSDPADQRFGYPFINCTQCGPRYTLITALPYDRDSTSMAGFPLCPDCRAEYADPTNRRFHAEPVACPMCGPHLEFAHMGQAPITGDAAALAACVEALRAGQVVAVKGVGGYHLMCDAGNDTAVVALRARKPRPDKPLAVMFPADGRVLGEAVRLTPQMDTFLRAPARPIVLLPKLAESGLSRHVAPGLNEVGCLLPYAPLHALLLEAFGGPLVATSGNISGEPVLTDNADAEARLGHIADAFLHHNRPIVRPADDSVFRPIAGRPRPLRLGRGTAPLELELPRPLPEPVLALGSHMKNTLCLAWNDRAVLSPHIGGLDAVRSLETLAQVAEDLQRLYQVQATRLLLDRHPGYGYRRWARETGLPISEVWHHHAHASTLAWEFPEVQDWIMFAWDGVGLGVDGTLWGGEAFVGIPGGWRRRASFRPFRLPGGEKAGREPWRSAAALLWEVEREAVFAPGLLHQAWQKGVNSPVSSAAGRLFDAAAAMTGVCSHASFEGEGPMRLEAMAAASALHTQGPGASILGSGQQGSDALPLPLVRHEDGLWRTDWSPLLSMLADTTLLTGERALRFHAAMAGTLVDQAIQLRDETGYGDVGLAGGVFQNRMLTELAQAGLVQAGFRVHLAERVPVNDAGVSFGQVLEYLNMRS